MEGLRSPWPWLPDSTPAISAQRAEAERAAGPPGALLRCRASSQNLKCWRLRAPSRPSSGLGNGLGSPGSPCPGGATRPGQRSASDRLAWGRKEPASPSQGQLIPHRTSCSRAPRSPAGARPSHAHSPAQPLPWCRAPGGTSGSPGETASGKPS